MAGYKQTNSKGVEYFLNTKEVTLPGNRQQTIYYFSKKEDSSTGCGLPSGFEVFENPRNGFLMTRRIKK